MTDNRYPPEVLDEDCDNGTMPDNVDELRNSVVGHRIVSAEQQSGRLIITLDNETQVTLDDSWDCCAYTELVAFLLHPESVDHIIMGVGTTDEYYTWHIYADFGDIMTLQVGWSCGNPFYYGYGFDIRVRPLNEAA